MHMIKESYERLAMDVTEFDAEDIITASTPAFIPGEFEAPVGIGPNTTNNYPTTLGF